MRDPVPGRQLLVASTGGHLAQLVKWAPRIGADNDSLWVTFESSQTHSLLEGRRVLHVPYVSPRDLTRTARALAILLRQINWEEERFTSAVSTGAAVALAGLGAARFHRIPSFYFESVSRVQGPSLTGRLVSLDPWIHKSCQYEHWSSRRWHYRGSLFDHYRTTSRPFNPEPRLFITLGTIRPYRFDALVDAVLATGLADERTVWQLGSTERPGLPGRTANQLSHSEFAKCAMDADVVITHSGVGTLMELLDLGVFPVVVPRRAARGEHVDDHQTQVAEVLASRGIALVKEAHNLDRFAVTQASATSIAKCGNALGD